MGEILQKSNLTLRLQARNASLLYDDVGRFKTTATNLHFDNLSRLTQRKDWSEYVNALREIRKGRLYADQLDTFLAQEQNSIHDFRLVQEQREVVEDIQAALNEGLMHMSVVMPTGSGKTAIFTKIAKALGLRTLVVTPSQIGVEQIQQTFADLDYETEVGVVYAHEKDFEQQVTITTYDSLRRNLVDGSLPDNLVRESFYSGDYDLVIFDEAHLSLTQDRIAIARKFQNCARLAFTATPIYNEEKEVEGAFGQIVHRMTIEDAVNAGILAEKISARIVRTNIDLSDVRITASGEYEQESLVRKINTPPRNNAAVDVYNEHFFGEQAIIRCANIEHAEAVKKTFEERFRREGTDLRVAVVHSNMPRKEINKILADVKSGDIDIVCSAKLLDFAFDASGISLAFNLAPTLSRVTEEQFGGRVVRKDRISGRQKHARVVDFLDRDDNPERVPITYAQILGIDTITSSSYKEPRRSREPAKSGIITGTSGSIWRYIDDPTEIKNLIRQLDMQDVIVDISNFITFSDIRAAMPQEKRETLLKNVADMLRSKAYRKHHIPSKKLPSTLYPPEIITKIPRVLAWEYPIAPMNWVTEKTFAAQVGRKWQTIDMLIDNDLRNHPGRAPMVRMYANKRGRSRYLSPEYQVALSKELHRPVLPLPVGYSTVGTRALQQATGFAGMGTMLLAADALVEAYNRPDWIIKGFWTGEHVVNLYADELRDLLTQQGEAKQAIPQALEGSWTFMDLKARVTIGDQPALKDWLNTYVAQHPDDPQVGLRIGSQGGIAINVIPERVESLLTEFRTSLRGEITIPEGFIVMEQFVDDIISVQPKRTPASIRVAIRRWLKSHTIELTSYRYSLSRKPAAGFPPDLVKQIKTEVFGIIDSNKD